MDGVRVSARGRYSAGANGGQGACGSRGPKREFSFRGHIASDTLRKTLATAPPMENFSCGGRRPAPTRKNPPGWGCGQGFS